MPRLAAWPDSVRPGWHYVSMTAGQWWHHLSVWAARQGQPPSHVLVLATGLLAAAAAAGHEVLDPAIWIPLDVLAAVLFAMRFRRFWVGFANEVIRGVRALISPLSETLGASEAAHADA